MYNPPSNKNWACKYPYSREFTEFYDKGFESAKLGKKFNCPLGQTSLYDPNEELNYWYERGYEDFLVEKAALMRV